jgi:hypothetical protein
MTVELKDKLGGLSESITLLTTNVKQIPFEEFDRLRNMRT